MENVPAWRKAQPARHPRERCGTRPLARIWSSSSRCAAMCDPAARPPPGIWAANAGVERPGSSARQKLKPRHVLLRQAFLQHRQRLVVPPQQRVQESPSCRRYQNSPRPRTCASSSKDFSTSSLRRRARSCSPFCIRTSTKATEASPTQVLGTTGWPFASQLMSAHSVKMRDGAIIVAVRARLDSHGENQQCHIDGLRGSETIVLRNRVPPPPA